MLENHRIAGVEEIDSGTRLALSIHEAARRESPRLPASKPADPPPSDVVRTQPPSVDVWDSGGGTSHLTPRLENSIATALQFCSLGNA